MWIGWIKWLSFLTYTFSLLMKVCVGCDSGWVAYFVVGGAAAAAAAVLGLLGRVLSAVLHVRREELCGCSGTSGVQRKPRPPHSLPQHHHHHDRLSTRARATGTAAWAGTTASTPPTPGTT